MEELIRTNNLVLLNYVQMLLKEADIFHTVLDTHMSTLFGSGDMIPQRIMVPEEDLVQAKRILKDANISEYD